MNRDNILKVLSKNASPFTVAINEIADSSRDTRVTFHLSYTYSEDRLVSSDTGLLLEATEFFHDKLEQTGLYAQLAEDHEALKKLKAECETTLMNEIDRLRKYETYFNLHKEMLHGTSADASKTN